MAFVKVDKRLFGLCSEGLTLAGGFLYTFYCSLVHCEKGYAFPSIAKTSETLGVSTRSIHRLNTELETSGLIRIKKTTGGGNRYFILTLPDQCQIVTSDKLSPVPNCHITSDKLSRVPVTKSTVDEPLLYIKRFKKKEFKKKDLKRKKERVFFNRDGFDLFWQAYPLKKSKGQAEVTWNKIKPAPRTIELMLTAIPTQKMWREAMRTAGQWCENWKNPSTWLNGQCWLDEVEAVPTSTTDDLMGRNIAVLQAWMEKKEKEDEFEKQKEAG